MFATVGLRVSVSQIALLFRRLCGGSISPEAIHSHGHGEEICSFGQLYRGLDVAYRWFFIRILLFQSHSIIFL